MLLYLLTAHLTPANIPRVSILSRRWGRTSLSRRTALAAASGFPLPPCRKVWPQYLARVAKKHGQGERLDRPRPYMSPRGVVQVTAPNGLGSAAVPAWGEESWGCAGRLTGHQWEQPEITALEGYIQCVCERTGACRLGSPSPARCLDARFCSRISGTGHHTVDVGCPASEPGPHGRT
jgi:hypothetical protein